MDFIQVFKSYSNEENIIAFSVMIQPLLVVLQFLMISVFFMPEEQTTKYRVAFTAIPMILAIIVSLKQKSKVFAISYICLFLFFCIELFLFPLNSSYILSDSFRFLVPIIIPSIICLSCLNDIKIIEDVMYLYSWLIVAMMLIFVMRFLQGSVEFESYNMGLSYALLLPMVILYNKSRWFSYIGAAICFLCILVFGSRGALVAGVFYIVYDMCQKNRRYIFYIGILFLFIINIAVAFGDYLDSLGISSRTLNLLVGGEMSSAEGRDVIYAKALSLIKDNWITGLGIYGDRVHMGDYCHNIILELLLDYGAIFGSLIILTSLISLILLYLKLDGSNKNALIKYTIVLLAPFFSSGSYLIDCNFGVYWGVVFLLYNSVRNDSKEVWFDYLR